MASSSQTEVPTTTLPHDNFDDDSDEDSFSHPSGFDRFSNQTHFQSLHDLLSLIQQSSTNGVVTAAELTVLENDAKHLVSNLKYIRENLEALQASSNTHRADELLHHLMDIIANNQPPEDFHNPPKDLHNPPRNLHYLLQIVAKLKHWVPPQPPKQQQQPEESGNGSSRKKKESPIVSTKDTKSAADEIVKTLVGYGCGDWGMDGLMRSYEGLGIREKLCLLCFSAFRCDVGRVKRVSVERDLVIKKRVLIYWWVGEGFIPMDQDLGENMVFPRIEKIGKGILKVLRSKGFIENEVKKGRESRSYKMHPFVHSFVTALAKRAGFFDFGKEDGRLTARFVRSQRACLVKSRGKSLSSCQVWKGCIDNRDKMKKFESVQTLFNVDEGIIDIKPEWFSKMKYLSVLHLGSWRSDSGEHIEVYDPRFLEEVRVMKQLKVFSLQGVSTIMRLPDSVCKLDSLMILDLRECHNLEQLPSGIGSLKNLTHLDITNCHLLTKLPKGISLLSKLEVLNGFVIYNQGGEQEVQEACFLSWWGKKAKRCVVHDLFRRENKELCTLRDLLELNHLRKLTIVVNRESFPIEEEVNVLKEMRGLRSLKISWEKSFKDDNPNQGNSKASEEPPRNCGWCFPGKNPETMHRGVGEEGNSNASEEPPSNCGWCFPRKNPETETAHGGVGEEGNSNSSEEPPSNCGWCFPGKNPETETAHRGVGEEGNSNASNEPPSNCGWCFPGKNPETETAHKYLDQIIKLELWCFPDESPPDWLVPNELTNLKKLYIKGGKLKHLGLERNEWNVETLRLKYLCNLEIEWRKLIEMFPCMTYLEKYECKKLGLFPCDHEGVWKKKGILVRAESQI